MLIVVVGLLERQQSFLCQTNKHSGLWEFPGGKLEDGETLCEALVREWREELNLDIGVGELITETVIEFPDVGKVLLPLFKVTSVGKPRPMEDQRIAWLTLSEIQALGSERNQPSMEIYLPILRRIYE